MQVESNSLRLKFKTFDGKSFQIEDVCDSSSVKKLKELCSAKCGVAACHQRLHLKSKQLADETQLKEAGLVDGSMLFVTKAPSWSQDLKSAPTGTVPCAGGCGFFGTSRMDNFCSKCYKKLPSQERDNLWTGILLEDEASVLKQEQPIKSAEGDSDLSSLILGAAVIIHGLQGARELNGRRGWLVKYSEDNSRFCVKLKGEDGTKAIKASNLKRLDHVEPLAASAVLVQKDKTKCWWCSKKCGLTGFSCRCGYVFCSRCRHAEDHACDFNHQRFGQESLRKSNPKVEARYRELLDGF
jgi:hypothetical protein